MSSEDNAPLISSHCDEGLSQLRKAVKSYGISIDSTKIHEVALDEQPESLRVLGVNVFDQDVFEEGVLQQVDEAIAEQEEALEKQRLEKELKIVEEELRLTEDKIQRSGKNEQRNKLLLLEQEKLALKKEQIHQRLFTPSKGQEHKDLAAGQDECKACEISVESNSAEKLLQIGGHQETEVERLVRLGEMTPFGTTVDCGTIVHHGTRMVISNEQESVEAREEGLVEKPDKSMSEESAEFEDGQTTGPHTSASQATKRVSAKGGERGHKSEDGDDDNGKSSPTFLDGLGQEDDGTSVPLLDSDEEYVPDEEELKLSWKDDQILPEGNEVEEEEDFLVTEKAKKLKKQKAKQAKKSKRVSHSVKDDGDDRIYQIRIREMKLKKKLREKGIDYCGKSDDEEEEFWSGNYVDEEFEGGLKIPGVIWNKLFRYQKTGVKWLWELHCQQAGGIVGDEMGLGKTIQVIAFLAGLKYSRMGRYKSKQAGLGPVLIICPATVLFQWVAEFHKWWPEFRVAVLHNTGSYQGPKDTLVSKIRNAPGVLITTYSGVRLNQDHLLSSRWDYVILDEGHIIRNPDAEVTLTCKQFRTLHRIILSGSPMQNNLRELWSLFDFVFPGKLGTLPVFMQEFSVPITIGGYANASPVQVQTAYKCACVLRDTINPYLLRRMKKDVKMKLDLPNKNEQVLFCRLTEEQTEIYKEYLASREVGSILSGTMKVFPGLIMLRKICNHPDLTTEAGSLWKLRKDQEKAETGQARSEENDSEYGDWRRSGKLVVVHSLLKLWKKQKHRVLLFTQTRQMLKILEKFVKSQGYSYYRMDGSTSISSRQPLISRFNKDKTIFVFLLTTRVGGLGVNLIGANRVIIYDPDWNPGTDMQAKERTWRVGQKRDVTIYRLLTTGTIEEKIYHRQIFKQFLTNRVLKDPKQRRFFKSNDLFELFTLDALDSNEAGTETGAIFAGLGCEVQVPELRKKGTKRKNSDSVDNASLVKMMRERTKEILKSQFSCSKKAQTEDPGTDSLLIGMNQQNEGKPGESMDVSEASSISNDTSDDIRKSSDCDRLPNGSDVKSKSIEEVKSSTFLPASVDAFSGDSNLQRNMCDNDASGSGSCKTDSGDVLAKDVSVREMKELGNASKAASKLTAFVEQDGTEDLGSSSSVLLVENQTKMKQMKTKFKKKSKKKRNKIEGIRIGQLSHSEPYRSRQECEDQDDTAQDEHYILRQLFKKTGVHSAFQHDTIVNSGNSDHILVENEAKRVAAQAAEALKRSRERCIQLRNSGLPTWTGQSGFVGSPHGLPTKTIFGPRTETNTPQKEETTTRHFTGESLLEGKADTEIKATSGNPLSSTQLLARMRARNFSGGNNAGSEVPSTEKKHEQTMLEIRHFIANRCSQPGRASTQEILEEFTAKVPANESAVFRAMLRTICDFYRTSSGEGLWILKPEFTETS